MSMFSSVKKLNVADREKQDVFNEKDQAIGKEQKRDT